MITYCCYLISSYRELIPICGRDLTCWRAFIPRVVTAMDSAGKPIWAFEVDVQRIDLRPEDDPDEYHWAVIRTYAEFYNLESKLTEFHGEFLETHLPAKKMFGTGKSEFLESVRLVSIFPFFFFMGDLFNPVTINPIKNKR